MIRDIVRGQHNNISVLIRINDIYDTQQRSFDVFVDPWTLFDSSKWNLPRDYAFRAAINEDTPSDSGKNPRWEILLASLLELPIILGSLKWSLS
jgi:hypothetical protein